VCGAAADRFEPISEEPQPVIASSSATKVIVVGAGIAGVAAVEALRTASAAAEITLVSAEDHLPYYRLNLTRYLAGEIAEGDLPIHPESWYTQQNVRLLRGRNVAGIALDRQRVALDDGQELPFGKLVLAAGASAAVPPIPGVGKESVFSVRTIDDANLILSLAKPGARCVCIGGGILGLETAGALARRGTDVAVIENHGWLLPRQLNEKAGRLLEQRVAGLGIRLHRRANVAEICGDQHVQGVRLQDGLILPADIVIIATGVRPNTEVAQHAGLAVNRGVVVDDYLTTSHPNVLAAGDLTEHRGTVYGLWGVSQFQGTIAGLNAMGRRTQFGGVPRSNVLKVLGIDLFSIGVVEPEGFGCEIVDQEQEGKYVRFVFREGRLVGAILLGDVGPTAVIKKAIETSADLGALLRTQPSAIEILGELQGVVA
jgi:nitrite reductase (NADH) large subunit